MASHFSSDLDHMNLAEAVFLSEFDIHKGSVLRHRMPKNALEEVGDDTFANSMLPEGCHARSSDETIVVLRRETNRPLYLLTLVATRWDKSLTRGASVKALGVATPHPHLISSLRAPLIIALNLLEGEMSQAQGGPAAAAGQPPEAEVEAGSGGGRPLSSTPTLSKEEVEESVLRDLLAALNTVDRTAILWPNERDRALMWRGVCDSSGTSAPSHCPEMWTYSAEFRLRETTTSLVLPLYLKRFCEVETVDTPLCSNLVLGLGPKNSVRLFNAVLAGLRVLIVGQTAAQEVGQLALAAGALVSPPLPCVLQTRVYPYVSLTDLAFLDTPGFIAGATNPMFAANSQWWDVLVQIHDPPSTAASTPEATGRQQQQQQQRRTVTVTTSVERAREDEQRRGGGVGRRAVLLPPTSAVALSSSAGSDDGDSTSSSSSSSSRCVTSIVEGFEWSSRGGVRSLSNLVKGGAVVASGSNRSVSSGGSVSSVSSSGSSGNGGVLASFMDGSNGHSGGNCPSEAQRRFDSSFGARLQSGLKTLGLGEEWVRSEFRAVTSACVHLALDLDDDDGGDDGGDDGENGSNGGGGDGGDGYGGGGGGGGDSGGGDDGDVGGGGSSREGGGGDDSTKSTLKSTSGRRAGESAVGAVLEETRTAGKELGQQQQQQQSQQQLWVGGPAWESHVACHQDRAKAVRQQQQQRQRRQMERRRRRNESGNELVGGSCSGKSGEDDDGTIGEPLLPPELLRALRRLASGGAVFLSGDGQATAEVLFFKALGRVTWDEERLKCLVNTFPESSRGSSGGACSSGGARSGGGGGVGNALLGPALFHADASVRRVALSLLQRVQSHPSTSPALGSLSSLLRLEMEECAAAEGAGS